MTDHAKCRLSAMRREGRGGRGARNASPDEITLMRKRLVVLCTLAPLAGLRWQFLSNRHDHTQSGNRIKESIGNPKHERNTTFHGA